VDMSSFGHWSTIIFLSRHHVPAVKNPLFI
jgi:hypothetical protein